MIFKPRRWRWVLVLVAAMLVGGVVVDIAFSRPISLRDLALRASAYAIGVVVATLLLRTDRFFVEIGPSTIRGPVRKWLGFTTMEAPLSDVDLLASRMSLWRGSFIRLKTGEKITLDALFMGMEQIRRIFDSLRKTTIPTSGRRNGSGDPAL
jgi:hypothetical protein